MTFKSQCGYRLLPALLITLCLTTSVLADPPRLIKGAPMFNPVWVPPGKLVLRVHVLANGEVDQVLIKESSGSNILDAEAVKQIRSALFQPGERNGRATDYWVDLPITYNNPGYYDRFGGAPKSAEQGNARAQHNLERMTTEGRGMAQNNVPVQNAAPAMSEADTAEILARQAQIKKLEDQVSLAKQKNEVVRQKAELAKRELELSAKLEQELRHSPSTVDDLTPLLAALPTAKADRNLYALIIGIDDYADVPDVPFARHSAKLFAEIARKKWGVLPENLILLTDMEATNGRLRARIKTLFNRLGPKDRLLVYYAGHGVPSQDGKTAYLLAQDGGPGGYEEADLQLESFYRQIEESRVGQASVFIDACFSGRSGKDSIVFEGVGGITLVPRTAVKPNGKLTVITAGRKDQFSNQDKTHGHRLFGYHLMKSMLEAPGNLNMTTLHEQIRDRVLADSRKIGPEFEQEPEMLGNAKIKIH